MTKIVIELAKEKAQALTAKAQRAGLSPEEFVQDVINLLLDEKNVDEGRSKLSDETYQEIKQNVLSKYAELYKRLA